MAPTILAHTIFVRDLYRDLSGSGVARRNNNTFGNWRDVDEPEAYIIEGWGEGFMLGALMIMAVITVANMRRGVLLHKLILLEVC